MGEFPPALEPEKFEPYSRQWIFTTEHKYALEWLKINTGKYSFGFEYKRFLRTGLFFEWYKQHWRLKTIVLMNCEIDSAKRSNFDYCHEALIKKIKS